MKASELERHQSSPPLFRVLEGISELTQEDEDTTKLEKGDEVFNLVLVASDQTTRVMKPCE